MSARQSLILSLGKPWTLYIPVRTTAGRAVDLTGCTGRFVAREDLEGLAIVDLATSDMTLSATGDARVDLTVFQTALFTGLDFADYAFLVTDGAGTDVIDMSGLLYIERSAL